MWRSINICSSSHLVLSSIIAQLGVVVILVPGWKKNAFDCSLISVEHDQGARIHHVQLFFCINFAGLEISVRLDSQPRYSWQSNQVHLSTHHSSYSVYEQSKYWSQKRWRLFRAVIKTHSTITGDKSVAPESNHPSRCHPPPPSPTVTADRS